jgi:DNA-binding transcriptional LysR family regulator
MQGTEPWHFVSGGETVTVRPHGRFKADNGVALAAAAVAGLGIARLPDFLIESHIASGALEPVLAGYPTPDAGIYVVRAASDFLPRKVRVLIDLLVERFGAPRV